MALPTQSGIQMTLAYFMSGIRSYFNESLLTKLTPLAYR